MSLRWLRPLASIFALISSILGAYWSVRLGRADWLAQRPSLEATSKSLELAQGNSTYTQYAAEIQEGNGGDGTPLRLRAATENPLDAANWIRLAARAEVENRMDEAERDLLQAYAVDHQFEPRWALANLYFRGDRDRALEWGRKTLEFGSGDLSAVFQLLWNISGDGREILDKTIPDRPAVLAQYLQFYGRDKLDEASAAARKLLPYAGPEPQQPALAVHVGRCLDAGKVDCAIETWNHLVRRGLIEGEMVDPESGKSLVNADFSREWTGAGFDWAVRRVDGIAIERQPAAFGVRLVFSRNEPENFTVLGEYIALAPERKYHLRFRYETFGMSGAGVKWMIEDVVNKTLLLSAGPPDTAVSGEHTVDTQFETPRGCRLARIELRYTREPGTVRPEGAIRFSHLELEFAP